MRKIVPSSPNFRLTGEVKKLRNEAPYILCKTVNGRNREMPTQEEKEKCRIITPEFRVSYPHLFEPQAPKGGKLKYSITMLYPKDKDIIGVAPGVGPDGKPVPRSLKSIMKQAKVLEFGPDKNTWPKLDSPISDGDDEKYIGKEGYKGHWVIKASTNENQRPSVVNRDMSPITDASIIYPGCYARAYIFAYVWPVYMNRQGVGFILDHVQKTRDGKSFSGKKPVEQVFAPVTDVVESDDEDDDE